MNNEPLSKVSGYPRFNELHKVYGDNSANINKKY